ncbi:MAG: CPBP family intramembrane metalloprotease [Kiritimatiellales bacterium]|nr:CPBP family intramembrane metalloprotease [Kiritimatiellales bacterium]
MDTERKKAASALLLIFLVAPVAGALVAPALYRFLVSIAEAHADATFWQWLADKLIFHRVVSRCVMIAVLFALYPAFRLSGIRNAAIIGLTGDRRKWKLMAMGAGLGIVSMLVFYIPGLLLHAFDWKPTDASFHQQLGEILLSTGGCLLIGVIEEIFFRGFLHNLLKRTLGCAVALLIGAAVYALIHFMKPSNPEQLETWYAGLRMLPRLFDRAGSSFVQQSLTLFGTGIVLTLLFEYTKSLYVSIGLHAGWVWVLMMFDQFTNNNCSLCGLYGRSEWISKSWMGIIAASVFVVFTILSKSRWNTQALEDI